MKLISSYKLDPDLGIVLISRDAASLIEDILKDIPQNEYLARVKKLEEIIEQTADSQLDQRRKYAINIQNALGNLRSYHSCLDSEGKKATRYRLYEKLNEGYENILKKTLTYVAASDLFDKPQSKEDFDLEDQIDEIESELKRLKKILKK